MAIGVDIQVSKDQKVSTTVEIWPLALTIRLAARLAIYNSRNLAIGVDRPNEHAHDGIYNSRNLAIGVDIKRTIERTLIYNSRNLAIGVDFGRRRFRLESTTVEIWPLALTCRLSPVGYIYNSRNLAIGVDSHHAVLILI